MKPPPVIIPPAFDQTPAELQALVQWLGWKWEQRQNKKGEWEWTKPPHNARTGKLGKSNDQTTWSTFAQAVKAVQRNGFVGIGFCLTGTEYVGLDLDGCRDPATGEIEPWAQRTVNELASYTELSPTGTGLRIIVRGQLPPGHKHWRFDYKDRKHHGTEMYDTNSPRYLTMTGVHLNGNAPIMLRTRRLARLYDRLVEEFYPQESSAGETPKPPALASASATLTDDELLAKAMAAKNGPKFKQLWDGDTSGYKSESEADLALCSMLAFWTGCDAARMDRLFRRSGLMRPKWDEPRGDSTWGRKNNIDKAIAGKTETYQPPTQPGKAGRPAICLTAPKMDTVIRESILALRQANKAKPRFFVQGLRMVHVAQDDEERPVIMATGEMFLRPELERVADFYAKRKDGTQGNARPTLDLASSILARPQVEWGFPGLRGVVRGPVSRPGGVVLAKQGYSKALRLYYAPQANLKLPEIPAEPTQAQCRAAAEVVGKILVDFPFVEQADRANYYGLLLTPPLRHLVEHVPLCLIDSPQKGTGKTLLAEVLGLVHEGQTSPMWTAPYGLEEWEKIMTTILLSGTAINVFDNVAGTLYAPVLAKVLTGSHSARIMRTHEEMHPPNTTTFVVTGNNIQVGGDLDRRCYPVRIDAKSERPWEGRKFKIPRLTPYVREHRGELLARS
jgi:hypothetical protein